jgi:transcriptional regulator with XRE-family HTH domain
MRVLRTRRLRELRERVSLSQMELSERSGVSRATIADLELGKRGAQPKTRRKLAAALGVEPWELVGDIQTDDKAE